MGRHGCPSQLPYPKRLAGAEETEKLAQKRGTSRCPTRQWGSGKERPLPAARLPCGCASGFSDLRLLRGRNGNGSWSVAQGAGLLAGGGGPERLEEPTGALGGFLLGLIDGGNNRVWKRSGAGGVLQCKGQRWSYPELERRPGAVWGFGKAMATHSSTLAWKIPWLEEPGRLQSVGLHGVGHDWSDLAAAEWGFWLRR